MSSKYFILLIALLFAGAAAAQDKSSYISTINKSALNIDTRDTAYISHLVALSRRYKVTNPDTAIILLQRALSKSNEIKDNKRIAISLIALGLIKADNGNIEEGKALIRHARSYCLSSNDDILITGWNNSMAYPYAIQGNHDSALFFYYRALHEIKTRKIHDTGQLLLIYSNLGGILSLTRDLDKSLYYLDIAEHIALKTDNELLSAINNNQGNVYLNKEEYQTARRYLEKSIKFDVDHNRESNAQQAYYLLGKTYIDESLPDKALPYFKKALALDSNNLKSEVIYQGLAAVYTLKGQYLQAEAYYKKALQRCHDLGLTYNRLTAYKSLAFIYTKTKQFEAANRYQAAYADLKDSLTDYEQEKANNLQEIKYRTSEKDREIAQKQLLLVTKENSIRRKNTSIAIISCGSLLLFTLLISAYRNNKQKQRIQLERMKFLQQEQEMSNLKAMMRGEEKERARLAHELHDGIMVQLSAIKMRMRMLSRMDNSDATMHEYNELLAQMDNTTKELRQTAHNLMPDMLLEGGLSEAIYYFCNKVHENTGLKINFHQYGDMPRLQPEYEIGIYRIVQELVQNIIKHAQARQALVQLNYGRGLLCVTVEDDGVGLDISALNAQAGMGLRSVRTRAKALNGNIDLHSALQKGTVINIEFDVHSVVI